MPASSLQDNRAIAILKAAKAGGYGVPAIVVYNLEGVVATVRAAEAKRSPAMLLLFPWAQTYSGSILAAACAQAVRSSTVPLAVHLDHAQSAEEIHAAAATGCFDSIMIDMSHYEHAENLARTQELVTWCHERGLATEAEPGRIEGGEDGIADTGSLQAMMTDAEEARAFVATGIDWLAPAFGNVHGSYGPRGVHLDYARLAEVEAAVGANVHLVLHGTDTFSEDIFRQCIRHGISKVNINKAVNRAYADLPPQASATARMELGTQRMQAAVEQLMDQLGSTGRA